MQKLFKLLAVFSLFGQVYASSCSDKLDRKIQNKLDQKTRNQSINLARRTKEAFYGDFDPRPKRERLAELVEVSKNNYRR